MSTTGPQIGTLLIHGGDNISDEFKTRFKQLAGAGPVYIPTAASDDELPKYQYPMTQGSLFGVPASVLHTRDTFVANTEPFVQTLRAANGVFIGGGRQPRLAESYLNTLTHRELENLLNRGGVIAGSSAGATILGSYMVRNQGCPDYDEKVMVDRRYTTEGFGFIKEVAIDQHVTQRNRESHLEEVLRIRPQLLGIGIDVDTAIVVQGNIFEVIGSGKVFIHDGTSSPYFTLGHGQKYNMQSRSVCG